MTAAAKRLRKELNGMIQKPSEAYLSVELINYDIYEWRVIIPGAYGSFYEGGNFELNLKFQDDYPFKAPTTTFVTKIFHPNISTKGKICLNILQGSWTVAYTIDALMLAICALMWDPNPTFPFNVDAASIFKNNFELFKKRARHTTKMYAKVERNLSKLLLPTTSVSNQSFRNSNSKQNLQNTPSLPAVNEPVQPPASNHIQWVNNYKSYFGYYRDIDNSAALQTHVDEIASNAIQNTQMNIQNRQAQEQTNTALAHNKKDRIDQNSKSSRRLFNSLTSTNSTANNQTTNNQTTGNKRDNNGHVIIQNGGGNLKDTTTIVNNHPTTSLYDQICSYISSQDTNKTTGTKFQKNGHSVRSVPGTLRESAPQSGTSETTIFGLPAIRTNSSSSVTETSVVNCPDNQNDQDAVSNNYVSSNQNAQNLSDQVNDQKGPAQPCLV